MTGAAAVLGAGAAATGGASVSILLEGWATLPWAATGMEAVAVGFSGMAVWFAYCTRLRYVKRIVVRQGEDGLRATVTGRGYLPFMTKEVETPAAELRTAQEYDEAPLAEARRPPVPFEQMNPLLRQFARLRLGVMAGFDAVSWYIGRRDLMHLWTEEGQSRKFTAWWLDRRGFYNQRLNRECAVSGVAGANVGSVLEGGQGGACAAGAASGGGAQGSEGEGWEWVSLWGDVRGLAGWAGLVGRVGGTEHGLVCINSVIILDLCRRG
jgi:hypothetical protein